MKGNLISKLGKIGLAGSLAFLVGCTNDSNMRPKMTYLSDDQDYLVHFDEEAYRTAIKKTNVISLLENSELDYKSPTSSQRVYERRQRILELMKEK